ncbi:nuclear transport factor 2 family protein [Larkinella soli]|uniref:nuclear transport factor 2 family protein n=1 Tax=Larkinella soli TaxID=1770527 RepID=UPI000FFC6AE7|nr:nuclear transport factor 2 family protein [Larkinella soli]
MKTLIRFYLPALLLLAGTGYAGTPPGDPLEKEKIAIRNVIVKETDSYYRQDFAAWKSTYVDAPYFRLYGYWEGYAEKVKYYNGFKALETVKKKQFDENRTLWQTAEVVRENENFRIYGEVAWYTCEETSYDRHTRKLLGKAVETRILEKHDGQWKIAYLGFHYLPLKAE